MGSFTSSHSGAALAAEKRSVIQFSPAPHCQRADLPTAQKTVWGGDTLPARSAGIASGVVVPLS